MTAKITEFLKGVGTDHMGRSLSDIWGFDDREIEHNHDFIQWLFPLNEPSMSVFGAPVLGKEDIDVILSNEVARANVIKSADWYLGFLKRNEHWIKSYDHNHLRITRTIKSLRLIVGQIEACSFRSKINDILGKRLSIITVKTQKFWDNACSIPLKG